jgi:hypothetical protein
VRRDRARGLIMGPDYVSVTEGTLSFADNLSFVGAMKPCPLGRRCSEVAFTGR